MFTKWLPFSASKRRHFRLSFCNTWSMPFTTAMCVYDHAPRLSFQSPYCRRPHPYTSFNEGSITFRFTIFTITAAVAVLWRLWKWPHGTVLDPRLPWYPLFYCGLFLLFLPQFSSHPAIFLSSNYTLILGSRIWIYELLFSYTSFHNTQRGPMPLLWSLTGGSGISVSNYVLIRSVLNQ